ncbi:MAG: ATP-binding cassette domain-containing protein [Phycisphaerae bacterium]|nr:ATP-binding cassette domain-containing protein [Phycisphaerae bacterium]
MIDVKSLSKHYGTHHAVDGISFSIGEGEIVGFLGPNGAGKTTTLRVLTCFHPATAGSATVAGYDVFTQSEQVRAQIGYLPESVPMYPEMRVREYLHFRGKLRGMTREQRETSLRGVVERCWLGDVVDRPIGQLSKGFRQRVGLADALLHNPPVLILDEPTVGLDPSQIRETRRLIGELAQQHTVLLSSHILPEVEATCQRIIIINRGRIVASGTPEELRERVAGTSGLIVELKAAWTEIEPALRGLSGVTEVRGTPDGSWTRVALRAAGDQREAVAALAAGRGWPLRELRREIATLEDFFVKIVAGAHEAQTVPVE